MGSLATKNAFNGYTFQYQIFFLFLVKMDYDRKISEIKAETFTDEHNFDDIYLKTNDFSLSIQIKNMTVSKSDIKFKEDCVMLKSQKIKCDPNNKNLLIVSNVEIETNSEFMGLKCYKHKNVFVCSLSSDEIYNVIENLNIDEKRIFKLMQKASLICSQDCSITTEDLPEFNFYNTELQEKTFSIRKNILDYKQNYVNFIIGKPGVGKSHFAKELGIENKILYRFWIGENDVNKNDRLRYENFIKDISYQLFNCSHIKGELEIIKKLIKDNKFLIIDGLDHVENYNPNEIENYFSFIKKIKENKGHIIILCRPLKHELIVKIFELTNWNKSQTKDFIHKKHKIDDYSIEERIYDISNGYPIIVDFLCKEYDMNHKLRSFPNIADLNEYYDTLISEKDLRSLYIFSKCRCFLTNQEIKSLLGHYGWSIFQEFMERNKFLFSLEKDRISLIHDSLNLYVRSKIRRIFDLDKKIQSYVVNSLLKNEIKFFSRFQSFYINKEQKLKIIKHYLSINAFKNVLYSNLDYESIRNFYKVLPTEMSSFSPNLFTELEYLQLAIIESIVARNHIEQNFELLIPLFDYLKKHKAINTYNTTIYSSETLYSLQDFNLKNYERYIDSGFYDVDQVMSSYNEAQYEYELFLSRINGAPLNVSDIDFKKISKFGDYWAINYLTKLKCKLYLSKNNFLQSLDFVGLCARDNPEYYAIACRILKTFNIETNQRNIEYLKNSVRNLIFQYGEFPTINLYKNKTLKEIIFEHAHEGSFTLNSYITSYIKHAIICNQVIDIESISFYWTMFYQRKDYSLDDIQTILTILKCKGFIKLQDCCNLINKCQNMTEKSYRHNFNDFLNNLEAKELTTFVKTNDLNDYRIIISSLNPDVINKLPQYFCLQEIYRIILDNTSSISNRFIEYDNIDNLLKSNYKDFVLNLITNYNITITNAPKEFLNDEIKIMYESEKYITGSQFEKGYAYYKDREYVKEKRISHLDLAKMTDGYYYRLPYACLFYHFDEKLIKNDLKNILFNALCLNNSQYFDFYLYNMSICSIIELFEHFNINIDWNKVDNIFFDYLNLSLVF